jgi:drug/metabolite transporter (DMT)-like permease
VTAFEGTGVRLRDFLILVLVCLIWAASNVLGKIVVSDWGVPPLYFVALRFLIVAAVTLPWLLPIPKPWWRMALIGLLMGAANFALLFIGLQTASPSAAGIVLQIGLPVTILLSVLVLGERIGRRRALGIVLTFAGVMIVMWNPEGFMISTGLAFVAASAAAGSVGGIMIKQMERMEPLRFQAWVAAMSLPPLAAGSIIAETGQLEASLAVGWQFIAALLFSALIVSVVAHTAFYRLIQRYEANLLTPLTLMTPLATIGLGVLITGDRIDLRIATGSAIAFAGVLIVAVQRNRVAPETVPERA